MRVYLDHAATTPISEGAKAEVVKWLDAGNASALYDEGRRVKAAIDEARETVSDRLGCDFGEVIFTGSGTESAVLAILGSALAGVQGPRRKLVFSATEHHCTLRTSTVLERLGFQVLLAPVDRYGRVELAQLAELLGQEDVLLVAAMHVNNELGTINSVREISEICHRFGTQYFCDAVQSFGKIPVTATDLGADLISLSGHKIYGPKGVGALYVRAGTQLKPISEGGGQERELRGGTENVAAISGFGTAVADMQGYSLNPEIKCRLLAGLVELGATPTLPESIPQMNEFVHVRFPGTQAETLLIALDRAGVSAGSGAACSSGSVEPSHVLLAAGFTEEQASEGMRFTLGSGTKVADIDFALSAIKSSLNQIGNKIRPGT